MDRCAVNNLRKLLFYESLFYNIGCVVKAACEAEEELDELFCKCRKKNGFIMTIRLTVSGWRT